MKPGDIVAIYEDPITREREEGKARLIEQYREDCGDGLSMWVVEFLDEPGREFVRTIYE